MEVVKVLETEAVLGFDFNRKEEVVSPVVARREEEDVVRSLAKKR